MALSLLPHRSSLSSRRFTCRTTYTALLALAIRAAAHTGRSTTFRETPASRRRTPGRPARRPGRLWGSRRGRTRPPPTCPVNSCTELDMTAAWQVGSPGPPVGSATAEGTTTPAPIAPAASATTSFLVVLFPCLRPCFTARPPCCERRRHDQGDGFPSRPLLGVFSSILCLVSSQVNARLATLGSPPLTRRWPQSRRLAPLNRRCCFRCSYVKKLMVMAVFLGRDGALGAGARCGGRGVV